MAELKLTQERKTHAVIVSLAAGHSDSEIATFLKLARSFFFNLMSELTATKCDVATVFHRKRHYWRSVLMKTPEFVNRADEGPRKLMKDFAKELQVDETSIRRVVHEYLR